MKNNEKYIINGLGGLGNQMFCYAFYKKLSMEYPEKEFVIDLDGIYDPRFEGNCELFHVFPSLRAKIADPFYVLSKEHKISLRYRGPGSRVLKKGVQLFNQKLLRTSEKCRVTEQLFKQWNNEVAPEKWNTISFFDGFWQDIDLYKDCWEEIIADFKYREIQDVANMKMLQEIKNTDAVSVHVRRGDYSGDYKFDILGTEYYSKIICSIQEKKPESIFYFFSNDPAYIKNNYSWLDRKVIVDINYGKDSYKDMILMSACKTNVVANSTFSIWASFLNENDDRIVFYPSHYFRNERPLDYDCFYGFHKVKV